MPGFKSDRRIAPNLLLQEDVVEMVRAVTEEVKAAAAQIAPGSPATSLTTEHGRDRTRPYGRVRMTHPGWIPIEFGGTKHVAKAPLRRAMEQAGLTTTGKHEP